MAHIKSDAARSASAGVEWLARIGYTAKAVVYVIVGVLAAMAAFGIGGSTTGTKGAVTRLSSQPHGQMLLVVMGVGLVGYVVWRFTQAFKDPEHEGHDFSGLGKRSMFFISGLAYGLLAVFTFKLAWSTGGGGNGGGAGESLTSRLMSHPGGVWAVAIIGAIIVGVGIGQFSRAYKEKFKHKWRLAKMNKKQLEWATTASKWGLNARGVVFVIIGGFLIAAAWQTDPSKATSLAGVLDKLARQIYGVWLLGAVALGLVCYGVYCLLNAFYRRINP